MYKIKCEEKKYQLDNIKNSVWHVFIRVLLVFVGRDSFPCAGMSHTLQNV